MTGEIEDSLLGGYSLGLFFLFTLRNWRESRSRNLGFRNKEKYYTIYGQLISLVFKSTTLGRSLVLDQLEVQVVSNKWCP